MPCSSAVVFDGQAAKAVDGSAERVRGGNPDEQPAKQRQGERAHDRPPRRRLVRPGSAAREAAHARHSRALETRRQVRTSVFGEALVPIEAWAGGDIEAEAGRPAAARRGGPPPTGKLYVFGIPLVDVTRADAVCVLTLRREEKLNALSTALERELGDALVGDEVRSSACVVVTGAGRAFSAGADLTELRDRGPEDIAAYYRETGDVYERVAALPQPTLSAIAGYCLGGGLELALATDFRIADETAVFGFPEVGLGILPSSGGTQRLARIVGTARAKELILLRERFDAQEALAAGVITEAVSAGAALDRALEHARRLAGLPALAVSLTKHAIEAMPEVSRDAGILIERLAYGLLAQTKDARGA
jgi:enoyl-CoA hydratase/carnithine racemase